MRNNRIALLLGLVLVFSISMLAQNTDTWGNSTASNSSMGNTTIASGTSIEIRTDQAINVSKNSADNNNNNNSNNPNNPNNPNSNNPNYPNSGSSNDTYNSDYNRTYPGTVARDVVDSQGSVVIPSGSPAQLAVVNTDDNNLTLDLTAITVNGQTYSLYADSTSAASSNKNGGLGANKRTGKYVGGGALAGTVICAITGGAKGAAIGAIVGGAAGAGTQVLTKGKDLNVPAETALTFRLNRDLTVPYSGQQQQRQAMPVPQQ